MDDRSVQYPQRYQLKKVEGTDDIYDLVPAPGEITTEGTLINKSALLKDETAALFKDLPEDPVPDDVFKVLSKAALVEEDGGLATPNGITLGQVKIQLVSYVGNGKYGQSNPCSLTFNFPVDAIFLICVEGVNVEFKFGNYCANNSQFAVYTKFMSAQNYTPYHGFTSDGSLDEAYGKISEDKKTFYWYSELYNRQLNTNGYTYTFIGLNFGEVT